MRKEIEQLLEKVKTLQEGAEFVTTIDISNSLNLEFDKKRIEMARGKAIAYEYVGGLIEDVLKKQF